MRRRMRGTNARSCQVDCPDGYEYQSWRCDCDTLSPILIDTAGDGYRLSSAEEGVEFDLNDNGVRNERMAWTEPDSDDGWLVLDRNGNGQIDSGAELFGSRTPAYADATEPKTSNGFDALVMAEGPSYGGGVADGTIDARDAVYRSCACGWIGTTTARPIPESYAHWTLSASWRLGTAYKKVGKRDQERQRVFPRRRNSLP